MIRLMESMMAIALSTAASAQTPPLPARAPIQEAAKSSVLAVPAESAYSGQARQSPSESAAKTFSVEGHGVMQGTTIPAVPTTANTSTPPSLQVK